MVSEVAEDSTAPTYAILAVLGERTTTEGARELRIQWDCADPATGEFYPDEWVPYPNILPETRPWVEAQLRYVHRHDLPASGRAPPPCDAEMELWAGARVLVDASPPEADPDTEDVADDISLDTVDSVFSITPSEAAAQSLRRGGALTRHEDGSCEPVDRRWFFATVRRNTGNEQTLARAKILSLKFYRYS